MSKVQPKEIYLGLSPTTYQRYLKKKKKSSQLKKIEREKKQVEMKQKRLSNAKDSAKDYQFERKYPTFVWSEEKAHGTEIIAKSNHQKDLDWEDWDLEEKPRSIEQLGVLSDTRIRAARARGEFDDLSGRGRPLKQDPLINNPFVNRTEYFLNRIIQRNGAAPPWVMMQQEVDTELDTVQSQMNSAIRRCIEEMKQQTDSIEKWSLLKQFNRIERHFFEKEMDRLNRRLRSYNVMCPEPVKKKLQAGRRA